MMRFVLAVSILNTAAVGALLWLLLKRQLRRSELEIILDGLDAASGAIHAHAKHTAGEHETIFKALTLANGRLQFLMAKEIADELSDLKKAHQEQEDGKV